MGSSHKTWSSTAMADKPYIMNYATMIKVADIWFNLCNVTSVTSRGPGLLITFINGVCIALDGEQATAFAKLLDNTAFDVMADE